MVFKLTKKYYDGDIGPFNIIEDSVEYIIEETTIKEKIYREYYGDIDYGDYSKHIIKGEFDLLNNQYELATKESRKKYFEDKKFTFENYAQILKEEYKPEFYIDGTPHKLCYIIVKIDNKEYKFANLNCKDETYLLFYDLFDKEPLLKLPHKMLKTVLKNMK